MSNSHVTKKENNLALNTLDYLNYITKRTTFSRIGVWEVYSYKTS